MATNGKLESRISFPANWVMLITETGGHSLPVPITLTSGDNYYMSSADTEAEDLLDTIETLIAATALNGTYTFSIDAGEGGTGRVTISCTGITSFAITWSTSELGELLGFPASISGSLSYTGTNAAQSVWLPGSPYQVPHKGANSTWEGYPVSDRHVATTSSGHSYAVTGQTRVENMITWPQELPAKTWACDETYTNESFESFVKQGIWGTDSAWHTSGGQLRWYPDAATDSTHVTYKAVELQRFEPQQVQEYFTGIYTIPTGLLIKVPS